MSSAWACSWGRSSSRRRSSGPRPGARTISPDEIRDATLNRGPRPPEPPPSPALRPGQLLYDRLELAQVGFVEPAYEERVDPPSLAQPAQLRHQLRDGPDHRVRRLKNVARIDRQSCLRLVTARHVGRNPERRLRDGDVAEQAQHA